MKLSIVSTLYNSSRHLDEFVRRCSQAGQDFAGDDYEIILVNDGSPDDSLSRAIALSTEDCHLGVVDLSRNFGHHQAMRAGLRFASGDFVFLIDSDLEEEPEWLVPFSAAMAGSKADVVFGVQESRKGGWFERVSGSVYYRIFNALADIEHPSNIVTARLMSRRYVSAFLSFTERELVISCLWVITGFDQVALPVKKHSSSPSTYTLVRKMIHVTNAVTSFSAAPLRMIFFVGLLVFAASVLYGGYLAINRVFLSRPVDGWTSLMISVWVLGGMIISFIGVVGIYLSKVFMESKRRPTVVIRSLIPASLGARIGVPIDG